MAFILCVRNSLLGHPLTNFDETLGVYRVDPEVVQRHIFDFRFRHFNFRFLKNSPTSGLGSETEVKNMTLHNLTVNSINPQSFIQIGPRVSEIMQVPPKMDAILV